MAFIAKLVDSLGLDHRFGYGAVWVVTVSTFDFAFNDRVMGKFVSFRFDVFVAFKALFWLLGVGLSCLVDGMAG